MPARPERHSIYVTGTDTGVGKMTGRRALERMTAAYESERRDGRGPPLMRSCTVRHGLRSAGIDRPPRQGTGSDRPDRPQGIT